MATLTEAMESADNETDLMEYVHKVKRAVIGSVEEMNPGVDIRDTGHFNHSAVPDLVLTWPGRRERPLYVRRSYDELAAGRDVERLAPLSPVFLSVGRDDAPDRARDVQRLGVDAPESRNVLVTNAATVDMFTGRSTEVPSPLTEAVAAQVFPSGQGLLDEAVAAPVIDGAADVLAELSGVLNEQALASVSLVAQIVGAARNGATPTADGEIRPFTMEEARDLLPWLLRAEGITREPGFWQFIAERVTVKHLEGLADQLAEVELSAICERGWTMWHAQRASLGIGVRNDPEPNHRGWYMRGRLLTYEVADAAVRFTTYGQAIKDRGGVSSATWEMIRNRIEDARLMQIALRGIARSIRIDAAESGDVRRDADAILGSVEDRYYIDDVTLRYGLADENRLVRVSFGDQIAHNLGAATVRDMLTALARVGAYRSPLPLPGDNEQVES